MRFKRSDFVERVLSIYCDRCVDLQTTQVCFEQLDIWLIVVGDKNATFFSALGHYVLESNDYLVSAAAGTGNCWHRVRISLRMRVRTASSSGARSASTIHLPICFISLVPMPRVVRAGVPIRIPEGSTGLRSS